MDGNSFCYYYLFYHPLLTYVLPLVIWLFWMISNWEKRWKKVLFPLYFAFIAFTVAHFFFFLILFEKIRWILQFEFVQEAGVTSMQPLVLQVRYFFFFFFFFSVLLAVLLCVFIFYFFWLHESDSKFGYFVFGSSCLADCITAGSECAVCKTTYAQTGSLLLSFACVAICPSAGVCLSILPYFIFWLNKIYNLACYRQILIIVGQ